MGLFRMTINKPMCNWCRKLNMNIDYWIIEIKIFELDLWSRSTSFYCSSSTSSLCYINWYQSLLTLGPSCIVVCCSLHSVSSLAIAHQHHSLLLLLTSTVQLLSKELLRSWMQGYNKRLMGYNNCELTRIIHLIFFII